MGSDITSLSFPLTLFFLGRLTEVVMDKKCTTMKFSTTAYTILPKKKRKEDLSLILLL